MKTRTLLIALTLLITVPFCCEPIDCRDESIIDRIDFKNFNSTEIDSLLFISFSKNFNFIARIDSFFVYYTTSIDEDTKEIPMPRLMDIQYDWEIKLISTQAIYRVTDFVIRKEECSSGGCTRKATYYNNLDSYKVNWIIQKDERVTIRK